MYHLATQAQGCRGWCWTCFSTFQPLSPYIHFDLFPLSNPIDSCRSRSFLKIQYTHSILRIISILLLGKLEAGFDVLYQQRCPNYGDALGYLPVSHSKSPNLGARMALLYTRPSLLVLTVARPTPTVMAKGTSTNSRSTLAVYERVQRHPIT